MNVIEVRMRELELLYQVRDSRSMLHLHSTHVHKNGKANTLCQRCKKFEKKILSLNQFIDDQYNLLRPYILRTETLGTKKDLKN